MTGVPATISTRRSTAPAITQTKGTGFGFAALQSVYKIECKKTYVDLQSTKDRFGNCNGLETS